MEVKIYTRRSPHCQFCADAKTLLEMHGIAYEEIDISRPGFDKEHLTTVIAPGATTVPIIFINGNWIGGFAELQKIDIGAVSKIRYSEEKIRALLRGDICEVTFTKVDGSTRVMKCTLNNRVIPVDKLPKTSEETAIDSSPYHKINTIVKVFDIEAQGWRSVNLTTVIKVEQLT